MSSTPNKLFAMRERSASSPTKWYTLCWWESDSPGCRKAAGELLSSSRNGPMILPSSSGPSLYALSASPSMSLSGFHSHSGRWLRICIKCDNGRRFEIGKVAGDVECPLCVHASFPQLYLFRNRHPISSINRSEESSGNRADNLTQTAFNSSTIRDYCHS